MRIREAQKSYGTDPTDPDPEHCWHRYRYHTVPVPTIYGTGSQRLAYRYTSAFLCSRKTVLITFFCRIKSEPEETKQLIRSVSFKYNTAPNLIPNVNYDISRYDKV